VHKGTSAGVRMVALNRGAGEHTQAEWGVSNCAGNQKGATRVRDEITVLFDLGVFRYEKKKGEAGGRKGEKRPTL